VHTPRSGFTYSPLVEWGLTAQWAGYKFFEEFLKLPGDKQSFLVALRRTGQQIEAIIEYENYKRSKRKSAPHK
jgi:hypothetical protein